MNHCPLPVEADQGRRVSGLLWCGLLAVVSGEGWPGQQLGLLRASWPHRCLDALQVWALSTYSSRPHALITGWIHRLAWKQRSSWGKWHQRSMGVICFKRSWAGCQVSHLRKHWPLSQKNKKTPKKEKPPRKGKRGFRGRWGAFLRAWLTPRWAVGEGAFSCRRKCNGLDFSVAELF